MIYFIGIVVVIIAVVVCVALVKGKKDNELRNRASQGDAQAQYDLARKYYEKKSNEAAQLFKQAAEQGHKDAQYELALCFQEGRGVEKDYAKAFSWFEKAADQGNAEAQYAIGRYYMMGMGVEENDVTALNWFKKAAANGSSNAQEFKSLADVWYRRGIAYHYGWNGKIQDDVQAMSWLTKAAKQGHAEAQDSFASYYGINIKVDELCSSCRQLELMDGKTVEEILTDIHDNPEKLTEYGRERIVFNIRQLVIHQKQCSKCGYIFNRL